VQGPAEDGTPPGAQRSPEDGTEGEGTVVGAGSAGEPSAEGGGGADSTTGDGSASDGRGAARGSGDAAGWEAGVVETGDAVGPGSSTRIRYAPSTGGVFETGDAVGPGGPEPGFEEQARGVARRGTSSASRMSGLPAFRRPRPGRGAVPRGNDDGILPRPRPCLSESTSVSTGKTPRVATMSETVAPRADANNALPNGRSAGRRPVDTRGGAE